MTSTLNHHPTSGIFQPACRDYQTISRSRVARLKLMAGQEALIQTEAYCRRINGAEEYDQRYNRVTEELTEAANYARGVRDALAYLLDADHPDRALAKIFGLQTQEA